MPELETYRRKRDFNKTPEPAGKKARQQGSSFVVQKHAARRLHYDFRLELDGVLLSWAVPKGPSLDPKTKRLAMQTEDHPIEYADFEGSIPKGEYGGGSVIVWDHGTWEALGDARSGYKRGRLKFRLQGKKLHGAWNLVKTNADDGKTWLLFKSRDDEARTSAKSIVDTQPHSVLSGRTLEEVESDPDRIWHSNRKDGARPDMPRPTAIKGARPAALPSTVTLALARAAKKLPSSDQHVYEIALQGMRLAARRERNDVRLTDKEDRDWAASLPTVVRALQALPFSEAMLDGEVVIFAANGSTDLQALQQALAEEDDSRCVFVAFDLLHFEGYDLRRAPLLDRKRALAQLLLASRTSGEHVRYCDHLAGDPEQISAHACALGAAGIVAKDASRRYQGGKSTDWRFVACRETRTASPKHKSMKEQGSMKTRIPQNKSSLLREYRLTHPERILYHEQDLTKRDLAEYYAMVADHILPHIASRPLTLVRCPEGRDQECFYQKHARPGMPKAVHPIPIPEGAGTGAKLKEYTMVDDVAGLVGLVQMGTLEIHIWGSRVDKLEKPDLWVFDLDPAEDVKWAKVISAAREMRDVLEALELQSFVKTTGGKGLHVVVPVQPRLDWDLTKATCKAIVDHMVRARPNTYIGTMSKEKRRGKVFLDYLRNGRGATAVAPFSTRARAGAPVATPLAWDELRPNLRSDHYNVRNLARRLSALKHDPWEGFFDLKQSLRKAQLKRLGVTG